VAVVEVHSRTLPAPDQIGATISKNSPIKKSQSQNEQK
jgi:hypothetical protein